jgi:hypothetical protein
MRSWQATALVAFPWHMQAAGEPSAEGGLPARLEPVSRIPVGTTRVGAVSVTFRPWPDDHVFEAIPGCQYAALRLTAEAEQAEEALEEISPALELILDDVAFQMQTGLTVRQLELFDITAPVRVGEEREVFLFPYPHGYQQWKFSRSTAMGTDSVAVVPSLRPDYDTLPKRTQHALDWYIKGLHAPVDADRFMFFWIALEVLEGQNGRDVTDVYRASCGHAIELCPTCGRSTSKRVAGPSLKQYLQSVGVTAEAAGRIWKMRQIVHGARTFAPDQLADLAELLQVLRAAVVALLKVQLGVPAEQPPFVGHGGPAIGPFVIGGHRAVDLADMPIVTEPG